MNAHLSGLATKLRALISNSLKYTRSSSGDPHRYLRRHPLCIRCDAADQVVAATVVDHIKPHRGDKALFWDQDNWQPLCKPCHDAKTAAEDGRWGAGPKSTNAAD